MIEDSITGITIKLTVDSRAYMVQAILKFIMRSAFSVQIDSLFFLGTIKAKVK